MIINFMIITIIIIIIIIEKLQMSSLTAFNSVVDFGSCTIAYECVEPRCENLTKCLQGVNSITNTIVPVNTIVEMFTPSLFLYCFGI